MLGRGCRGKIPGQRGASEILRLRAQVDNLRSLNQPALNQPTLNQPALNQPALIYPLPPLPFAGRSVTKMCRDVFCIVVLHGHFAMIM